jgi:predicted ABC-type ATPase
MTSSRKIFIFAGPNGSGKSTLYKEFSLRFPVPYCVNADYVEQQFRTIGFLNLSEFGVSITPEEIVEFDSFLGVSGEPDNSGSYQAVSIKEDVFKNFPENPNTEEASFISFLRKKCIQAGHSFAFETVLCHPSRLQEIKEAVGEGYEVNLYYIGTETPEINIYRIQNRLKLGGHPVNKEKVVNRYKVSLDLLVPAIKLATRSFIFDNSGKECKLIGEFKNGELVTLYEKNIPDWFFNSVLAKTIK